MFPADRHGKKNDGEQSHAEQQEVEVSRRRRLVVGRSSAMLTSHRDTGHLYRNSWYLPVSAKG